MNRYSDENECEIAKLILGHSRVVCGVNCPIFVDCPRIILQDANDLGVEKALKSVLTLKEKYGSE